MAIVICGFPGVGKTTLFKELSDKGYKILDSDSSQFPKEGFPENYIAHIEESVSNGYVVLASTHAEVRKALAEKDIPYILARPSAIYQKEEYLQRYRNRESPEAFIELMEKNWEKFYNDVATDFNGEHWLVGPGEYLDQITSYINNR